MAKSFVIERSENPAGWIVAGKTVLFGCEYIDAARTLILDEFWESPAVVGAEVKTQIRPSGRYSFLAVT